MGLQCEIKIFKPFDGAFTPGKTVTGVIKYSVDEDMIFKKITISLKGNGNLLAKHKHKLRHEYPEALKNSESYVDINDVVKTTDNGEEGSVLPKGSYQTQFSFELPHNIPATFKYYKNTAKYLINCHIRYYVRVKFEKPGLMNFAEKFKKEITVLDSITPRLSMEPLVLRKTKIVTQLFPLKKSICHIKATAQSCVIRPGHKIKLDFEVFNGTNFNVKSIETKLMEVHNFTACGGYEIKDYEDVLNTETKTGSLKSGEAVNMSVDIIVPPDLRCLENSHIVSREYIVTIIAELPFPHRNAALKIPVQIGDISVSQVTESNELPPSYSHISPPSYYELMGEDFNGVGETAFYEEENYDKEN